MSDNPARSLEHTLLGTSDAMVWAEEFCRLFDGKMIAREEADDTARDPAVDPGLMVSWFANAMQTAINIHERRRAVTEAVPESRTMASMLEVNEAGRIDYAPQFGEEEDG